MIVDRLYQENEDMGFNEVSPASNKERLSGLQALSFAHDTLKQEAAKSSEEIRDSIKTIKPTINQLMQQKRYQEKKKQNSQIRNQQQNKPRNNKIWNNQKRSNNNWNICQINNNRNNNNNNNGKRNRTIWQNGRNNHNYRKAQSSQRHCCYCS